MIRTLPQSHALRLKSIEDNYCWFNGRVFWATELLKQIQKNKPLLNYVDLGCGTGGFAQRLIKEFKFSKYLLIDGDQNFSTQILDKDNFKPLDLQTNWKLPFQPDLITCMDVLEHLENDSSFLRNVFNSLQDGGILLISTPNHPFFYSSWDEKIGHFRRYSKNNLKNLLLDTGFKINLISSMWSFLSPVLIFRKLQQIIAKDIELDFPELPYFLNSIFSNLSKIEYRMRGFFPFGLSLLAVCEKK